MNVIKTQFTVQEWDRFFSVLNSFEHYCQSARASYYGYSSNFSRLYDLLCRYRTMLPDEWGRQFIDMQIRESLRAAKSAEDKQLHNFIVLEYIAETKRSKNAICRALHISRTAYEDAQKRAIDRLCVLVFGAGGVEWWKPR